METEKGESKVCATAMAGFDSSSYEVKGTLVNAFDSKKVTD